MRDYAQIAVTVALISAVLRLVGYGIGVRLELEGHDVLDAWDHVAAAVSFITGLGLLAALDELR